MLRAFLGPPMLRWKADRLAVALVGVAPAAYFTWALLSDLASAAAATDQFSAALAMLFAEVMAPGVVALWLVVLLGLITAHRPAPEADPFDAPPSY